MEAILSWGADPCLRAGAPCLSMSDPVVSGLAWSVLSCFPTRVKRVTVRDMLYSLRAIPKMDNNVL